MPQLIPLDNVPTNSTNTSSGPQLIPLDNVPQASSSSNSSNIGDKIASAADYIKSGANAFARGAGQSMDSVAATLNKAIAKYTGIGGVKPQDIQDQYEANDKAVNNDPDVKAHSWATGAGRVAGGLIATAPVMAAMPESASLFGASTAGKALGAVATNTAQGALQGGLMTNPGQGSDVINTEGAETGALFGAALSPVQGMGNAYAKDAANYETYANQLKSKYGYKGPIFDTDVPANQGWYNTIKQTMANNLVSQIPFVNKLPVIGMEQGRNVQQSALKDTIANMVKNISDANPNGTYTTFKNQVNNVANSLQDTIAQKGQVFRQQLDNAGITDHALDPSTQIAAQSLLGNSKGVLTPQAQAAVKTLTNDSATTGDLLGSYDPKNGWTPGAKQQLWAEAQRLGTDPLQTNQYVASQQLKGLYGSVNDDVTKSLMSNPNALTAWHDFNTTTHTNNQLVENAPLFAKAVDNVNKDSTAMQTFYNALKGKDLDPSTASKYTQLVGPQAMNAVRDGQVQTAFTKAGGQIGQAIQNNFDGNTLNLNTFIKQLTNTTPGTSQDTIRHPIVQALQGLTNLIQKNQEGIVATKSNPANDTLKTGLIAGATALFGAPLVGAVLGAPQALGTIIRNAPLKNSLMLLNKLPKTGTGMSQYLLQKANSQLTKAGVVISHDSQNNAILDMQGDQ